MNKKGCIYKITNLLNNKIYIGQTTMNPTKRWGDHIVISKKNSSNQALHSDMHNMGIENFSFQIIKDDIALNLLDEEERKYINIYNSMIPNGYNIQKGGQDTYTQVLNETDVQNIRALLKTEMTIAEIALSYNVTSSTISDINCGDTWYDSKIKYPIRESQYKHKKFSDNEINNIYQELRNFESYVSIGNKHNVSSTTIAKINAGKIYRRIDVLYPISNRNINLTDVKINKNQIQQIAEMLLSDKKSMKYISRQCNVTPQIVSKINQGKINVEVLNLLGYDSFPIRKIL